MDKAYDFKRTEERWRGKYVGLEAYKGTDFDESREKMYVLTEFPYPSGSGLHVGHAFSMTGADVYARFWRMKGKNVLFPMGWDAFGLPTENYAIKTGISPQVATKQNTDKFKEQMKQLGMSFDWDREINTTDSKFYKWTQWIFIKMFEKGLVEKQEMPINWCPKCKVGLANEEVVDGRHERCDTEVVKKNLSQWVVKITEYAEKLIDGLEKTTFIEKVKSSQINWIGRKEGALVRFKVKDFGDEVEVFTTRPDTLEGVTFMVIAPEHPLALKVASEKGVAEYLDQAKKKNELERTELQKEKTGVFSGLYAINSLNQKEVPIWIADYVVMSYGTGAIMGVPSHDERDGEFAAKYELEVNLDYTPDEKMLERIEKEGWGEKKVNYHLRDWIFSRQHYWGEPIPLVDCKKCGWVPVPESELPVTLPEVEKYEPTETGESPLANIMEWVETKCPRCGGEAKRETDTMPNWAGSDWYFLRYLDPHNGNALADMKKMEYWMPVDVYVGGDEHNTLHLLYSRFVYQFLHDLGYMPNNVFEPYERRVSHGVILGPDGNRMSKSKGNVIVPDEVANKFGADALRGYLMFIGPFDATMAWNERSLMGVKRFIDKLYRFVGAKVGKFSESDPQVKVAVNKMVRKVEEDLPAMKFNTAMAAMMEGLNEMSADNVKVSDEDLKKVVKIVAPIMPFVAEEMWSILGENFSVHAQEWPTFDEKYLIEDVVKISVQVNGKTRSVVEVPKGSTQEEAEEVARKDAKVETYLNKGKVLRVIFIKDKTISFVVG